MALNFLGLGFNFGGKDFGLSKLLGNVSSGAEKIHEAFDRISEKATVSLADSIDSMAVRVEKAPQIAEGALEQFATFLRGMSRDVETFDTGIGRQLDALKNRVSAFAGVLKAPFQKVSDVVGRALEGVKKHTDKVAERFSVVSDAAARFGANLSLRFEGVKMGARSVKFAMQDVSDAAQRRFPTIGTAVDGVRAATAKLGEGWHRLAREGGAIFRTIGTAFGKFGERFHKDATEVAEKVDEFGNKITKWGKAKKILSDISDGLQNMKEHVTTLTNVIRLNAIGNFFDRLREGAPTLQGAASHVSSLATENRNLTTSLESTMTQYSVSARRIGANTGLMGRDLSRFTGRVAGMAYANNVSVETAAEATTSWTRNMEALRAVGIRSASDMMRLQEVTGMSSRVLGDSMRQMRREFGMSDQAMQAITNSAVAAGQSMQNVGGAMEQIPALMGQLRQRASLAGRSIDNMDLAHQAQQVYQLAAGFRETGDSFEAAMQHANTVSDSLIGAQRNIQNMFGGTETELSSFAEGMGIATGDINSAFRLMQSGPAGMVEGLTSMVQAAQHSRRGTAQAMNFLRSQLEHAMGPEQADRLMSFFNSANASTLQLMHNVGSARRSLRDVGRAGFSAGITLEESFSRAEQSFITSFRNIGRRHSVAFVRDTTRQFGRFNQMLHRVVAAGGPLAGLVERFSTIHQIGTLGLIPETLRPLAAVLGTVASAAMPAITAMGALGLRLDSIFHPTTLLLGVVVGLVGWFTALRLQGVRTGDAIAHMAHTIISKLESIPRILSGLGSATSSFFDDVRNALRKVDWPRLWRALAAAAAAAVTRARQAFHTIGEAFVRQIRLLFSPAGPTGRQATESTASSLGDVLRNALLGLARFVLHDLLPALRGIAVGIFHGLQRGVSETDSGPLSERFGAAIGTAIRGGIERVAEVLGPALELLWNTFNKEWVKRGHRPLGEVVHSFERLAAVILAVLAVSRFVSIIAAVSSLISVFRSLGTAVTWIGGLFGGWSAVWTALTGALTTAGEAIAGVVAGISGITAAVVAVVAAIVGLAVGFLAWPRQTQRFVDKVTGYVQRGVAWIAEMVTAGIAYVIGGVVHLIMNFPRYFMMALSAIGGFFASIPGFVMRWVPRIWSALERAIDAVLGLVWSVVRGLIDGIERGLLRVFPGLRKQIKWVFGWIRKGEHILESFVRTFGNTFRFLRLYFSLLWRVAKPVFALIWKGVRAVGRGFAWLYEHALKPVGKALLFVGKIILTVLIAPFYLLYKVIRKYVVPVFAGLWKVAKLVFKGIWLGIKAVWEVLKLVGYVIYRVVRVAFLVWWNVVKLVFKGIWAVAKLYLGLLMWEFKILWSIVKVVFRAIAAIAVWAWKNVIKPVWEAVRPYFVALWEGIKVVALAVWDAIKEAAVWVWEHVIHPVWEAASAWFISFWNDLGVVARAMWDGLQLAAVNAWHLIRAAWDVVSTFFSTLFHAVERAVETSIDNIVGIFRRARQAVSDFFGNIEHWVDVLFGHSIHTVVGRDMDRTVEEIRGATQQIAQLLETALFDAVTSALTQAFTQAYVSITRATQRFIQGQMDLMTRFSRNFTEKWIRMWNAAISVVDNSIAFMEQRIGLVLDRLLHSMSIAQAQEVALQAQTAQVAGPPLTIRRPTTGDRQQDLLMATHYPEWWTQASGGGQALLQQILQQLITMNAALVAAMATSVARRGQPGPSAAQMQARNAAMGTEMGLPVSTQAAGSGAPRTRR